MSNNVNSFDLIDEYAYLSLDKIFFHPNKVEILKIYKKLLKEMMNDRISKNVIADHLLIKKEGSLAAKMKLCLALIDELIVGDFPDQDIIKYFNNSIGTIHDESINAHYEGTSQYLFPGDIVYFHPIFKESRTLKERICHISGAKITKGELYVSYSAFIDNVSKKNVYIIKKDIIVETYYKHILPTSLHKFEEWDDKLGNSYTYSRDDDEIDFYNFNSNYGDGFHLRKIR